MQTLIFILLYLFRNAVEPFIQPGIKIRKSANSPGRWSLLILVLGHMVSAVAVAYLLYRGKTSQVGYVLGMMFFLAGFAGRVWSVRTLGKSYSQFVEAPSGGELCTSGPYASVRHPIYAFYLLEMFGFLIIKPNVISLAALAAVAAAELWRIPWEERVLVEAFGQEYVEYRKRTSRLVPCVF